MRSSTEASQEPCHNHNPKPDSFPFTSKLTLQQKSIWKLWDFLINNIIASAWLR